MSQESSAIRCPKCGENIDVNTALSHQLEATLQRDYEDKLDKALKEDRAEREQRLKKRIEGEQAARIQELERDLDEKSRKVGELNKAQSTIEKLKREKQRLSGEIEAKLRRELNEQFSADTEAHRKTIEEDFKVTLEQQEQRIARLQRELQEAAKKAQPVAPELQGGAYEKIIADYLKDQFPLDTIERIGLGKKGADILQAVNTPTRPECGVIYYESKNTQRFDPKWIETFKRNMLEKNVNIGVLVTKTMPRGMDRLGLKSGIWICSLDEFKGLCFVLRDSIIQINEAMGAQENRDDKMAMLYDFLTGREFRSQVEAIVEGFTKMKSDLERERNAMQGMWMARDRQINDVLLNTNRMYRSIKEIAGNAIQTVSLLELPSGDGIDA